MLLAEFEAKSKRPLKTRNEQLLEWLPVDVEGSPTCHLDDLIIRQADCELEKGQTVARPSLGMP